MPEAVAAPGTRGPVPTRVVRDDAADLVVWVVLVVGVVGWGGLLLGLAGAFGAAGVGALAVAGGLLGWAGRPAATGPRSARWAVLEPVAVFAVAASVLLPGWDVAIYGTDATVYRATGVHLARTGSLAMDDTLLAEIWPGMLVPLFPAADVDVAGVRLRSPAGLAFEHGTTRVWSAFSQLPSVWQAVGWSVAGGRGVATVTPLLAAAALAAFWLVVRRHAGLAVAAVATGLQCVLMVQVMIARLGLSEVGAQLMLWGGALALWRWEHTRAVAPALAAGVGFGLAAVTRLEYLAFVPVALGFSWLLPGGRAMAVPRSAIALALAGWATATALLLIVPSHYRLAFWLFVGPLWQFRELDSVAAIAAAVAGGTAVAALAVVALWRMRAGKPGLVRAAVGAGLAAWVVLFLLQGRSASAGQVLEVLRAYTVWPVLLLGVAGLVPLGRAMWASGAGRLVFMLAVTTGVHLAVDLHASAGAVWAGRRLLPVVLPALCAGVGAAIGAVGRRSPALGLAVAAFGLVTTAEPTLRWVQQPWYADTSDQVAAVAALVPEDAVAIVDGGLADALLDVALWLEHDRPSVVTIGVAGATEPVLALASMLAPRRLVLLRHAFLQPPARPGLQFQAAGNAALKVRAPTAGSDGSRMSLVPIAAWEVHLAPPAGTPAR